MQKEQEIKSNAKETRILFKKYNKIRGQYYKQADFTEPALLLIRRDGKVNFFDGVTPGKFAYVHTNKTERNIILNEQGILTFPYGAKSFKGYICHEDYPTPLPMNPVLTAEEMNIAIEKTLHDIRKWRAEEIKAWGALWWKIAIGIAIVIAIYAVYVMLKPPPAPIIQAAATTATTI